MHRPAHSPAHRPVRRPDQCTDRCTDRCAERSGIPTVAPAGAATGVPTGATAVPVHRPVQRQVRRTVHYLAQDRRSGAYTGHLMPRLRSLREKQNLGGLEGTWLVNPPRRGSESQRARRRDLRVANDASPLPWVLYREWPDFAPQALLGQLGLDGSDLVLGMGRAGSICRSPRKLAPWIVYAKTYLRRSRWAQKLR